MKGILGIILNNLILIGEFKEKQENRYIFEKVFIISFGISSQGVAFSLIPFAKTLWVYEDSATFFEPEQKIIEMYEETKARMSGIYLGTTEDLIKKDN